MIKNFLFLESSQIFQLDVKLVKCEHNIITNSAFIFDIENDILSLRKLILNSYPLEKSLFYTFKFKRKPLNK